MNNSALSESLSKLNQYIAAQDFKGYDPYDVQNSRLLCRILGKSPGRINVLSTQLNRTSPVNLRKALQIHKDYNSKGMALFASAYLCLYEKLKQDIYLNKAISCLSWLEQHNREKSRDEYSLGFTFDITMKTYSLKKAEPSVIITLYAGNAFIDGYEILGEEKYLESAVRVANFLINRVPITEIDGNAIWFSYLVSGLSECYNATSHAAAFLARLYFHTEDISILRYSEKAMNYMIKKQRPDGSWRYAESVNWTDNYHTGFVLESLARYMEYADDHRYKKQFDKGIRHYKKYLFLPTGQPMLYHPQYRPNLLRRMPAKTDIRDCAQGILVFSMLNTAEGDFLARKIALWTIREMQSDRGHFFYQANSLFKNKVEFIRWQAWMLLALAKLL